MSRFLCMCRILVKMSWLADSFLQDLEDIEGAPADLLPEEEVVYSALLSDSSFVDFINEISSVSIVPSMHLLEKCSQLVPVIEAEIVSLYRHVLLEVPVFDQVISAPMDYLLVVEQFLLHGPEFDPSTLDLPTSLQVGVAVTLSTLQPAATASPSKTVISRISLAKSLHTHKQIIFDFLANACPTIFPNLSVLLGPVLAAKLVAAAGGVGNLAAMPSQNLESVGRVPGKGGLIETADLVVNAPSELRKRALRLVIGKSAICARMDQFSSVRNSIEGTRLREEIQDALEVVPPPARAIKPLPVPIEKPKNKRGGRRHRKAKEKFGITATRKLENRMQFGNPTDSLDYGGKDRGMIGTELGHGRIRKV